MLRTELGTPRERRLLKRFRALGAADRDTLENFAEFLVSRQAQASAAREPGPETGPETETGRAQRVREPRPVEESVIAAMKRLRRSYPELDAGELLDEASLLMSAHMLQGRPAAEVIDELERLFARHAGKGNTSEAPAFGPPDAQSVLCAPRGIR